MKIRRKFRTPVRRCVVMLPLQPAHATQLCNEVMHE
jgi:hypothetical protein